MISWKIMPGICVFLAFSYFRVFSQAMPVPAGGTATGDGGTATYTAGLPAFAYQTGTSGTAIPGMQHVYEVSSVSGIRSPAAGISMIVAPNPAMDVLILTISDESVLPLAATLYDAKGVMVSQWNIASGNSFLHLSDLRSDVYFLKITKHGQELNTFKILKK